MIASLPSDILEYTLASNWCWITIFAKLSFAALNQTAQYCKKIQIQLVLRVGLGLNRSTAVLIDTTSKVIYSAKMI